MDLFFFFLPVLLFPIMHMDFLILHLCIMSLSSISVSSQTQEETAAILSLDLILI